MNIQLQSMVNYVQLQWGNKLSTANIEQPKVLYDYNGDGEPSLFELDNRHRKYLQLVAVLCFRMWSLESIWLFSQMNAGAENRSENAQHVNDAPSCTFFHQELLEQPNYCCNNKQEPHPPSLRWHQCHFSGVKNEFSCKRESLSCKWEIATGSDVIDKNHVFYLALLSLDVRIRVMVRLIRLNVRAL